MNIKFKKMHGCGNDFIMIDDMDDKITLESSQVRRMCDRHFGIGADGVIIVKPPKEPGSTGYMHYINADGTLAQMCGNGIRCTAKLLTDNGYASEDVLAIDTLSGTKKITYICGADGKMTTATVDMGQPIFQPEKIPTTLPATAVFKNQDVVYNEPLVSPWCSFHFTCVSMGNPHAVAFIDDFRSLPDAIFTDPVDKCLDTLNLELVGPFYESHRRFPEKTNVEFAYVDGHTIHMRVWERGCGETLACGTGACATAVAAVVNWLADDKVDVALRGGTLQVEYNTEGHVMMTGPAEEVFSGEWHD